MGTIKDYLQPSPIEKYFAHRDMWDKYFSINNRWVNQNVMNALEPLQIAMQPYLNMMSIAQSANNAIIASMTSPNPIATGLEQLQHLYNVMQPMAEYQSLLHEISKSISMNPISDCIDLSEINLDFDMTDDYDVTSDSLSEEESELVNEISRDNKLISYLKSKYHQLKDMPAEKVALYVWNRYIHPVIIGLITAYLTK